MRAWTGRKRRSGGYRTGRRFEQRVRTDLELRGWMVIRSAGSKGPADLVALRAGRRPLVVACSVGGVRPAARRALLEAARRAGARPVVARRARGRRGQIVIEVVA